MFTYFIYVVPFIGVIALVCAALYALRILRLDAGTEKMREIADAISGGAKAFLYAEYRVLVFFTLGLFC